MIYAWKNNQIISESKAVISLSSAAVLNACAVFDGCRIFCGNDITKGAPYAFNVQKHLNRFADSCSLFGLSLLYDNDELNNAIARVIKLNKIKEPGGLRLFALVESDIFAEHNNISVFIFIRSLSGYTLQRPYTLGIAKATRSTQVGIPYHVKAMAHYAINRRAALEEKAKGYDDALFLNEQGCITETPRANIIFFNRTHAVTPSVDQGILPGITRESVKMVCQKNFIWEERPIPLGELATFDSAVLCSSSLGVVPVIRIGPFNFKNINCAKKIIEEWESMSSLKTEQMLKSITVY